MATLTLKNVPDDLYRRLKARAEQNHRSLNREAIRSLEASFDHPEEEAALMARIRENRRAMAERGVWVTPEMVARAVEEGRP